jgi:small conductance mechanosensitive channel
VSSALDLAAEPDCATRGAGVCRGVWNLTHLEWLASATDTVARHGAMIVLILVVAVVSRYVLHKLINRMTRVTRDGMVPVLLRPLHERATQRLLGAGLLTERRRQRGEAIGSILRSIVSFVIVFIAFVMVLGELGLNLAPILATTSIAGVAIGFGAQSLVKDFLSGIFMLMEDQFGVGDYIDVATNSGTVESVGLRTTRIRDQDGVIWHLRNGELLRVGNASQGRPQVNLDIPIPYDMDPDAAGELLLATARSMRDDDEWSRSFTSQPELLGIERFAANAVVLRLTVRTTPGRNDAVARELRSRVKRAFEAAGTPIATTGA